MSGLNLKLKHLPAIPSVVGILAALLGCSANDDRVSVAPPFERPTILAVAPILNFSGEFHLDPVKAADLLASELSYVDGVTVLPVNRVVALLASQGRTQIESPAHALEVADGVGAAGIVVAGITEYDAYAPVVGVVLQLYAPNRTAGSVFDGVAVSRMAQPLTVQRMADPLLPTSQVQTVYNAAHDDVQAAVRRYARPRSAGENHLGWRQYLKVQTQFLRFCWHDALGHLMNQERSRRIRLAIGDAREDPA